MVLLLQGPGAARDDPQGKERLADDITEGELLRVLRVGDHVKPHDGPRGPRAARLEKVVTHSCNVPETAVTHNCAARVGFSSTPGVLGFPSNVPLKGLLARAGFS